MSDVTGKSINTDNLPNLVLARAATHNGSTYYQTISGHLNDLLYCLRKYIDVHFPALKELCRMSDIPFPDYCRVLFMIVGFVDIGKLSSIFQQKCRSGDYFYPETEGSRHSTVRKPRGDFIVRILSERYRTGESAAPARNPRAAKSHVSGDMDGIDLYALYGNYLSRLHACHRFRDYFPFSAGIPPQVFTLQDFTNKERLFDIYTDSESYKSGKRYTVRQQKLISVALDCFEFCCSVADRAFLRKIISDQESGSTYIIGGTVKETLGRKSLIETLNSVSNARSKEIEYFPGPGIRAFFSDDYDEKIRWITRNIKNRNNMERLIIVSADDEQLIAIGSQLSRDLHVRSLYYSSIGTFKTGAQSLTPLDTLMLRAENCTEKVNSEVPDTCPVMLIGYLDFLYELNKQEQRTSGMWGKLLSRSLVMFDVPCWHNDIIKRFSGVLRFLKRNERPVLIASHEDQKSFMNAVRKIAAPRSVPKKKAHTVRVQPETDWMSPQVHLKRFSLVSRDGKELTGEFLDRCEKYYRENQNQVVLCPNSVYAQNIYYRLALLFREKKWHPGSLILHHSMFGFYDKCGKMFQCNVHSYEPLILVTTLRLFPVCYGKFPIIYAENLPLDSGMRTVCLLISGLSIRGNSTAPQLYWSYSGPSARFKKTDTQLPEKLTKKQLKKLAASTAHEDIDRIENVRLQYGDLRVAPTAELSSDSEIDLKNRINMPVAGKLHYRKIRENMNMHIKPYVDTGVNLYKYVMPYQKKLGLIGDPSWFEEYLP
ncbi:hypothetical protein ACFL6I_07150 [candidate division KSB1 bacterium]